MAPHRQRQRSYSNSSDYEDGHTSTAFPYGRTFPDHELRRPLIEQVTNAWRDDEKKHPLERLSSDDSDDDDWDYYNSSSHDSDLDQCSWFYTVRSLLAQRRVRRSMFLIISLIVIIYYTWKWYLRPQWEEEALFMEGFNNRNGTWGMQIPKDTAFRDVVQVQDLEERHVPGGKGDEEGKRRLIFVGDVHGCREELEQLLKKVNFDKATDHLVLTGDTIAKGPDSAGVVDLLISLNASSVRGNHEDRILTMAKTKKNFELPDKRIKVIQSTEDGDVDAENRKQGEIALSVLRPHHLKWLRSLPLILRIPTVTSPSTSSPTLPAPANSSPSSDPSEQNHKHKRPSKPPSSPKHSTPISVVHAGLVPAVPLGRQDPHSVMNMRSINPITHVPYTQRQRGVPWERLWSWYQDKVDRGKEIRGFSFFGEDFEDESVTGKEAQDEGNRIEDEEGDATGAKGSKTGGGSSWKFFPWLSSNFSTSLASPTSQSGLTTIWTPRPGHAKKQTATTVIYGHDSSTGLNLQKWTRGLDSGCVNGDFLTALILDAWGRERLVYVDCLGQGRRGKKGKDGK